MLNTLFNNLDFEKHGFLQNIKGDERGLYIPFTEENSGYYLFSTNHDSNNKHPERAIEWILVVTDLRSKETELWRGNIPDQTFLDYLVNKFIYTRDRASSVNSTEE